MKRPDSKSKTERRGGDRIKVRKVGRIVPDGAAKAYSCIILDLSETGALLLVHDKVPDRFALYYSAKKLMREAHVVRRQQDTLAVRFEGDAIALQSDDKRLALVRNS